MAKERIGNTFLHGCGEVFQARSDKIKRCPRCDVCLRKGDLVKITRKVGKRFYKDMTGSF